MREWVTARAAEASLDRRRTSDLVLAVNEAVSNTLVHSDGNATVRIWRNDEELVCEVSDRGHIDDPLVGRRAPAAGDEGGRGVWMINHLCDLVELRSGQDAGTVLRLHVTLA
jgi:anti-sigma regulatory factor (Ser/Thr protein kinase)